MSHRAFEALSDLTITPQEALRRFAKMSKRWKPVSVGFVLHMGAVFRNVKQERALEARNLDLWCDDGGRA